MTLEHGLHPAARGNDITALATIAAGAYSSHSRHESLLKAPELILQFLKEAD